MSKSIFCFVCYSAAIGKSEFSLFSVVMVALAALSAFIAFVAFRYKLSGKVRKTKKLISTLEKKDKSFRYETLCKTAREAYFAVHKALCAGDISFATEYISEEFSKELGEKATLPKIKKEDSENIRLKEIVPVSVYDGADDKTDCIWFYVNGESTDSGVDAVINEQLVNKNQGSAPSGEYWQFVRFENGWVLNKILQASEEDKIAFIG